MWNRSDAHPGLKGGLLRALVDLPRGILVPLGSNQPRFRASNRESVHPAGRRPTDRIEPGTSLSDRHRRGDEPRRGQSVRGRKAARHTSEREGPQGICREAHVRLRTGLYGSTATHHHRGGRDNGQRKTGPALHPRRVGWCAEPVRPQDHGARFVGHHSSRSLNYADRRRFDHRTQERKEVLPPRHAKTPARGAQPAPKGKHWLGFRVESVVPVVPRRIEVHIIDIARRRSPVRVDTKLDTNLVMSSGFSVAIRS